MNNRHWLEIAEYISLFGSVVGSVAAVVSGQVIYAFAPLSLSMLLNLVNRYRFEQRTQQRVNVAITRTQRQSQDIQSLRQQVFALPTPVDLNIMQQAITATQADLQSHLTRLEQLDIKPIHDKVSHLQEQYASLRQSLDTVSDRLDLPQSTTVYSLDARSHLSKETIKSYEYELVFGRHRSREVLMAALNEAQKRLIIVCPWLTPAGIKQQDVEKFKALLERKVDIDIGWGRLLDLKTSQTAHDFWYGALPNLQKLSQTYPNQFRLKALGTNEKYLICDDKFALLGSYNLLSADDRSQEKEAGIRTTDPQIIQNLIDHFESAPEIEFQPENGLFYNQLSSPEELIGMMRESGLSEEELNTYFNRFVKPTESDDENLLEPDEDIDAWLDIMLE